MTGGTRRCFAAAASGVALACQALAAEWFVRTDGNDANNGTSWGTAFATISNAVAQAALQNDTIWVSNGTYNVTQEIILGKAVSIIGTNGAAVTTVAGPGSGNIRIFRITTNAVLKGLTITGGYRSDYGAGIWMTTGTVQNCIIVSNGCYAAGGSFGTVWAAGIRMDDGIVSNCTIISNNVSGGYNITWGYAGGLYVGNGAVRNCRITDNSVDCNNNNSGGGVFLAGGLVENCLIVRNNLLGNPAGPDFRRGGGGGVKIRGGTLKNCTIADNTAANHPGSGVRQFGGTIQNCIVCFNAGAPVDLARTEESGGSIAYSCSPQSAVGPGNITLDPWFVDRAGGNYQLDFGSPAIDAGTNITGLTSDLAGNSRPQAVYGTAAMDMGCYEALPVTTGVLRCAFTVATNRGLNAHTTVFTAQVGGDPSVTNIANYTWDLGNGETPAGAGRRVVTNATPYAPAAYDVSLTVDNGTTQPGFTRTSAVQVVSNVAYAATAGTPQYPYSTWAKAATNLQAAVDAAAVAADLGAASSTVWVSNGTYNIAWQVSIERGVAVRSTAGPASAVIRRSSCNTRVASLTHANAVLEGFTLRDGELCTISPAGWGGGVYMSGGTLSNCIVRDCILHGGDNYIETRGNGVLMTGGLIVDCVVSNNSETLDQSYDIPMGGGIYMSGGTVRRSVITKNRFNGPAAGSRQTGAGICMMNGTVEDCRITYNDAAGTYGQSSAPWHWQNGGGGVWMQGGTLESCLVMGNRFNGVAGSLNGGAGVSASGGRIINCTIVGNQTTDANQPGGGLSLRKHASGGTPEEQVCSAIAQNCIVVGNSSPVATSSNVFISTNGSSSASYSCSPDLTNGAANVTSGPLFVLMGSQYGASHVAGNYHLFSGGSPCVNAGTSQYVTVTVDLDGNARKKYGIVDMGAFEYVAPAGTVFIAH